MDPWVNGGAWRFARSIACSPSTMPNKPMSAISGGARGPHLDKAVGHADSETHDEGDECRS